MTDDRTYIKVHDGMPDHPKVDGLSDPAFRLLVELWCWCSRHLTNGRIPYATWLKRGSAKSRQALIDAGLAEQGDDEVTMHDYLEHQRSAAEVAALREKRREAGKRGGEAKAKGLALARQTGSKAVPETDTDTELLDQRSSSPKRRKAASPPPERMEITDEMNAWAAVNAPDVRLVVETARLLDWARGKGERKADWTAAWRNWMSRAQENSGRQVRTAQVGYTDADRERPAAVMTGNEWREGA